MNSATKKQIALVLIQLFWLFAGALPRTGRGEDIDPIKPAPLRSGGTIALVAPSGEINVEKAQRAAQRLRGLGYVIKMGEDVGRRRGYLAGTDQQRADELMAAFLDPQVDAIFPITGGYGTTRMLDRLDFEAIARNPKLLIGFSDITGLHLAIGKKCNLVTIHSPNPEYGIGSVDGLPEFHASSFWRALGARPKEPLPWGFAMPTSDWPSIGYREGVARGRTVGGNLSLIAALMGTPYEIETDGRILYLEDIREAPYRVDRMLSQLRLAGKLDNPAGVILGAFHRCESDEDEESLTLDQVLEDYFGHASYPVIKNFPAGHGPWNATIPLLTLCEIDGTQGAVRIVESPVKATR